MATCMAMGAISGRAAMGAQPSNKAHTTKKLEFGQSWHFGQFRHAGSKNGIGYFIRAVVPAACALQVGRSHGASVAGRLFRQARCKAAILPAMLKSH